MKPGTIVEIEWQDHCFYLGEYAGFNLSHQRSVGFFVSEDENVIRIAQSMTTDDGAIVPKPNDVLVVDKRTLIKRRAVR